MGLRRLARERAVQFLFQHDLNPVQDLETELSRFWESHRVAATSEGRTVSDWGTPFELPPPTAEESAVQAFAEPLIRGTLAVIPSLDEDIKKYALNWDVRRMAVVDRNVLRLAIYEMKHREDIPPIVSINEAVDIAKKFSTEDSGKFVNGILDRLKGDLLRPARGNKT